MIKYSVYIISLNEEKSKKINCFACKKIRVVYGRFVFICVESRMLITIGGKAGSGKSTMAKLLAEKL